EHRRLLAEDTGLEPGKELVELERRILGHDPSLDRVASGRPLRGYTLGDVIGEGAFSLVYRGTQPSLGREVAVKQIRAELANRPEFIRRFEAEAQMIAHLEHPYVVPLYDYWREPDTAYLIMRWLRGGTLEDRLAQGRLDVDEALKLVRQVGSALGIAHRAGVVHRDVKPANVFLDGEGDYFLGDFGIALGAEDLSDPSAALSAGSPAYASPEQLRREAVGPPSDVHGLGISVFEALTGQLPFPTENTQASLLNRQLNDTIPLVRSTRTDVPDNVDEVLQRATAKDPADRYQSIEEFVRAFEDAIEGSESTPHQRGVGTLIATGDASNPYRGLRPFNEPDAGQFFGRDRLVDELVNSLKVDGSLARLVTVVGPSGSGKSSAVHAGLIPALRAGAVTGSSEWFITSMTPGESPFEELETALLRVAVNPPDQLLGQLTQNTRGISRATRRILPDAASELLIVIDQFEELFTLCDNPQVRRKFL
ncbi:MAG: serine/threonine-protein kinase PknK, partial [Actinomycetia bacterium]|nr:serine/threonine-protein kinase PknK [Actinomycetes bacterium]